jgi:rare lipoprotein A
MMASLLSACSAGKKSFSSLSREDRSNTKYKGHFKVGEKYTIKGKSYKPKKYSKYSKVGKASWYGSKNGFHGKKTANGDLYNKELLTAAHKELPMPCLVKVKNLENGQSLIVLVNDRGPFSHNREIDVSEKAASLLGFKNKGIAQVKIQYLHSETQKMLKTFGLNPQEGYMSKRPLPNKKCSVNCHVKLVNLKYGYNVGG